MLIMPSFKKNMIVEQFQGNYLNSRNGYQPSGILSNDDGDGKENGKKSNWFRLAK